MKLNFLVGCCVVMATVALVQSFDPYVRSSSVGQGSGTRQIYRDDVEKLKSSNKRPRPEESAYGNAGSYAGYNPSEPYDVPDYKPAKPVPYKEQYKEDYQSPSYQEDYVKLIKPQHQPTFEEEYNKPFGSYEPEPQYYKPSEKPAYQDDYQEPVKPVYKPKPSYQEEDYNPYNPSYKPTKPAYKPEYKPEYKPSYEPEYKPEYKPEYEPEYKPEYKPSYEPEYEPEYKPSYKPEYKPSYKPEYPSEPSYQPTKPAYSKPAYEEDYGNPYEVEVNLYGDGYKKNTKPYPDDYFEPVEVYQTKPRPTYPKEVVLLKPGPAVKATNAYKQKPDHNSSAVPGTAGKDYPNYASVPETSFRCKKSQGEDYYNYMYADPEARCQVFHSCLADGRQDSFLCPTGTIFDDQAQTCDWWFNTRCY